MTVWIREKLGDVASIERRVVNPGEVSASTPYIGLENLEKGGQIVRVRTVGQADLSSAKFRFTEKQVLFGKLRPYLAKIARPAFDGICSTDILPILPGPRLDRSYLAHFLSLPETISLATARATGANLPRISPKELATFRIPIPPIEEQRRIAAALDQADELRARRRQTIALFDDLAQSIFLDMFESDSDQPPNLLGNRLKFVTSGGRGWAKYYTPSGSRFIRSLDVRMNEISNRETVYVTAPDNAEARRTRVVAGDVLLTITGSLIGRVAATGKQHDGSYISQHVAILRTTPDEIDPDFLAFYLSLPSGGQRQIRKMQYGQTKPGLNFDQIRAFRIPDVPIEEQRKFVSTLQNVQEQALQAQQQLAHIDALYASLEAHAFNGRL